MKKIVLLIIGIIFIIVSIVLRILGSNLLANLNKEYTPFENVNKSDEKAYIHPETISLDDGEFYLIYKNDNIYVLKSGNDLSKIEFDGKYTRVIGTSKSFKESDKNRVLRIYNDFYSESEESVIELDEFNNEFGNYYLEASEIIDDTDVGTNYKKISRIAFEISLVFIVLYIINIVIDYKKQI